MTSRPSAPKRMAPMKPERKWTVVYADGMRVTGLWSNREGALCDLAGFEGTGHRIALVLVTEVPPKRRPK